MLQVSKFILLFLAILDHNFVSAKLPEDSLIIWQKNMLLSTTDFLGSQEKLQFENQALSGVEIDFDYYRTGDTVYITISAVFNKWLSAINDSSERILNHEQGHFDLCELTARKFRKHILNVKDFDASNYGKIIRKGYSTYYDELNQIENQYDSETENSNNQSIQDNWNKRIKSELNETIKYESTLLKISIK